MHFQNELRIAKTQICRLITMLAISFVLRDARYEFGNCLDIKAILKARMMFHNDVMP